MKVFVFTLCVLFSFFGSQAQKTYVTENQLSYDVLHWHYDRYNNAENDEWYKIEENGSTSFEVTFLYENQKYIAEYDAKGNILTEKKVVSIKTLPSEIKNLLDYRIVKYKMVSYSVESHFENKQVVAQTHSVDARSKTGGQILMWFDKDFNFIPQREIMTIASNN